MYVYSCDYHGEVFATSQDFIAHLIAEHTETSAVVTAIKAN